MKKGHHLFWIVAGVFLSCLTTTSVTQAQIISDGTLSTEVITTNNQDFIITKGTRVGSNLFHSFKEFSVLQGGSASFANANNLDVKNIISRVTGTSISKLDGLITANGSANLFLINPNGIIFGPNASLDIGGSFVASTASSLLFGDGTQFSATNPQTPALLTVSVPIGLQFGQTAMPIHVEGSDLIVPNGKTLALLGGDVVIKGGSTDSGYHLLARTGRIELGSVAANSLVSLTPIAQGWKLGYNGVQNFQDIKISQAAYIDTSGFPSGAMQLRGRRIAITDGSSVATMNYGNEDGQLLEINASESVEVSGDQTLLSAGTTSDKAGADIRIETRRLTVRDGARVDASTFNSGPGGKLTVNASESVEVVGTDKYTNISTASFEEQGDAGTGGTVHITTRKLILRDGGVIVSLTYGQGMGGDVIVDASESVEASGLQYVRSGLSAATQNPTGGQGGNIRINTQRLVVQGGARITAAATRGSPGNGGTLDVNASDSVEVIGTGGIDDNGKPFRSSLVAESKGSSDGGNLRIDTEKLTVRDGAEVSVSSPSGQAGRLTIRANSLLLDRGQLTATTGASRDEEGGANIRLEDLEQVLMTNESLISAQAMGYANGGNIKIDAGVLVALPPDGANGSDIIARADQGNGGKISINAQGIFRIEERKTKQSNQTNDIDASSDFGASGEVEINTLVDPSQGLTELPTELVDPSRQIDQSCAAREEDESKFTVIGRTGLPQSPNEVLTPDMVLDDFGTLATGEGDAGMGVEEKAKNSPTTPSTSNSHSPIAKRPNQIVEAQGWVVDAQGVVTLVAQAPTVTPHTLAMTSASCPTRQLPQH
jgi:filamentous hemagglutinin family protein